MWRTPVGRLRVVGWVEGLSFVTLVFFAMPLKYVWGEPEAVRIVGMAHGVLWLAFCLVLLDTTIRERWSVGRARVMSPISLSPVAQITASRYESSLVQTYSTAHIVPTI